MAGDALLRDAPSPSKAISMLHNDRPNSASSSEASRMGEVDASLLMAVAGVLLGTVLTVTAFLGSTPEPVKGAGAPVLATICAQSAPIKPESSPAQTPAFMAEQASLESNPESTFGSAGVMQLEILPVESSTCASAHERCATTS
ncbi:MAG: hypothetical protein ACJAQ3_000509 [Planctomycetota bacterium]|jgi:hypothetical protein